MGYIYIYYIYIYYIYMYIIRTYHIFDILIITEDFDPISEDFFVPEFVIKALRRFRWIFDPRFLRIEMVFLKCRRRLMWR